MIQIFSNSESEGLGLGSGLVRVGVGVGLVSCKRHENGINFARSRLRDWLLYPVAAQNEQVGNCD